jgi:predicted nucleic acid-binding protein
MFLVDTDVLSLLRRPERSPDISRWMAGQRTIDLYMSVVSIAEIERGITRQRRRD